MAFNSEDVYTLAVGVFDQVPSQEQVDWALNLPSLQHLVEVMYAEYGSELGKVSDADFSAALVAKFAGNDVSQTHQAAEAAALTAQMEAGATKADVIANAVYALGQVTGDPTADEGWPAVVARLEADRNEPDTYNLVLAEDNDAADTHGGTDGEQDVFVFQVTGDQNGAFVEFGEDVIENYRQADGDTVLFVDDASEWNSVADFVTSGVTNPADGATIGFNNLPADGDQSLQILDAVKDPIFGSSLGTLENSVDFAVASRDAVDAMGLADYIDAHIA